MKQQQTCLHVYIELLVVHRNYIKWRWDPTNVTSDTEPAINGLTLYSNRKYIII